jgi:hypothetical protein
MKKMVMMLILLYVLLVAATIIGLSLRKPKAHGITDSDNSFSDKLAIIGGDVKPSEGKDIDQVTQEYFYDCSQIIDNANRLRCVDAYFSKYDDEFIQTKKECSNDKCLDELYYNIASSKQAVYCYAIKDSGLREQCINTIK